MAVLTLVGDISVRGDCELVESWLAKKKQQKNSVVCENNVK